MAKVEDKNGFWFIEHNPITKTGVYDYLGKQISPECEPNKIYKVLRPKEELFKKETLDSLRLIPIVNDHTMIGTGFTAPEDKGIDGTLGDNVSHDTDTIYNDLKIMSNSMKEDIRNGKKELSLGYFCRYDKQPGTYKGQRYDYIQRDIKANHLALVDKGRMGADVRVYDSKTFAMDSIDIAFDREFKESDVNRDDRGRFASKGSSGASNNEETEEGIPTYKDFIENEVWDIPIPVGEKEKYKKFVNELAPNIYKALYSNNEWTGITIADLYKEWKEGTWKGEDMPKSEAEWLSRIRLKHADKISADNTGGDMALDDEDIEWITVRGTHIPIKKGESKEQAVKKFLEGKKSGENKSENSSKIKIGDKVRFKDSQGVEYKFVGESRGMLEFENIDDDSDKKGFPKSQLEERLKDGSMQVAGGESKGENGAENKWDIERNKENERHEKLMAKLKKEIDEATDPEEKRDLIEHRRGMIKEHNRRLDQIFKEEEKAGESEKKEEPKKEPEEQSKVKLNAMPEELKEKVDKEVLSKYKQTESNAEPEKAGKSLEDIATERALKKTKEMYGITKENEDPDGYLTESQYKTFSRRRKMELEKLKKEQAESGSGSKIPDNAVYLNAKKRLDNLIKGDANKEKAMKELVKIKKSIPKNNYAGREEADRKIAKKYKLDEQDVIKMYTFAETVYGQDSTDTEEYKKTQGEDSMAELKKEKPVLDEDKRKIIDEIGGILKGKVDEELWRTVIGKAEKLAYNASEAGKGTDEGEEVEEVIEEKEEKAGKDCGKKAAKDKCGKDKDEEEVEEKEDVVNKVVEKKGMDENDVIKVIARKDKLAKAVAKVIGTFDHSEMTEQQVAEYACDKLDLPVKKGEEITGINCYLKSLPKERVIFSYGMDSASKEDAEFEKFQKGE